MKSSGCIANCTFHKVFIYVQASQNFMDSDSKKVEEGCPHNRPHLQMQQAATILVKNGNPSLKPLEDSFL